MICCEHNQSNSIPAAPSPIIFSGTSWMHPPKPQEIWKIMLDGMIRDYLELKWIAWFRIGWKIINSYRIRVDGMKGSGVARPIFWQRNQSPVTTYTVTSAVDSKSGRFLLYVLLYSNFDSEKRKPWRWFLGSFCSHALNSKQANCSFTIISILCICDLCLWGNNEASWVSCVDDLFMWIPCKVGNFLEA